LFTSSKAISPKKGDEDSVGHAPFHVTSSRQLPILVYSLYIKRRPRQQQKGTTDNVGFRRAKAGEKGQFSPVGKAGKYGQRRWDADKGLTRRISHASHWQRVFFANCPFLQTKFHGNPKVRWRLLVSLKIQTGDDKRGIREKGCLLSKWVEWKTARLSGGTAGERGGMLRQINFYGRGEEKTAQTKLPDSCWLRRRATSR